MCGKIGPQEGYGQELIYNLNGILFLGSTILQIGHLEQYFDFKDQRQLRESQFYPSIITC